MGHEIDEHELRILVRALCDGIELHEMIERSNRIACPEDKKYGRIVERGVDITGLNKRRQRDYRFMLAKLNTLRVSRGTPESESTK